jgi:hypothetical protein
MKRIENIQKPTNAKGAAIFKKMIEDKKAIREHFQKGGKILEIQERFNFVKPISIKGK